MFTNSIKRAREIRKFNVAVVQRRKEMYKKSVMHLRSCCFANINLLTFRPCLHGVGDPGLVG